MPMAGSTSVGSNACSSTVTWQPRKYRRCAASHASKAGLRSISSPARKSPAKWAASVRSRSTLACCAVMFASATFTVAWIGLPCVVRTRPRIHASASAVFTESPRDPAWAQITHGMEVNSSPRAATGPDFSRPAMGCVPT